MHYAGGQRRVSAADTVYRSSRDQHNATTTSNIPQTDINDLVQELRKLSSANRSLKEDMRVVDEQVRQTQLALESLIMRSSNNNKHLQDLLLSQQDVKKLRNTIAELSEQQRLSKREAVHDLDKFSSLIDDKLIKLLESLSKDALDHKGQVAQLQEAYNETTKSLERANAELKSYKDSYGELDRLTAQISAKRDYLAQLQIDYAVTKELLGLRAQSLDDLESKYRTLEANINDNLVTRYKALQETVMLSSESVTMPDTAGQPISRITRVTSMLRSKYGTADLNRRVMSLSSVPTASSRKPYLLSPISAAATNNSDLEEENGYD